MADRSVEEIARRGMEDPASLTPDEIREVALSVLVDQYDEGEVAPVTGEVENRN